MGPKVALINTVFKPASVCATFFRARVKELVLVVLKDVLFLASKHIRPMKSCMD